jgi:hypothetical protein
MGPSPIKMKAILKRSSIYFQGFLGLGEEESKEDERRRRIRPMISKD